MQKQGNIHTEKMHRMPSGRQVVGVSHSWARSLDEALEGILAASPELQHAAVNVPMSDRDVLRLFHSKCGTTWRQVRPADLGRCKFNFRDVVRGAQELDGDPAFDSELTAENLRLRQIAGRLLAPRVGEHVNSRDQSTHFNYLAVLRANNIASTLHIKLRLRSAALDRSSVHRNSIF